MRSLINGLFRPIAVCLVLCLMFPASEIGTAAAQEAVAEHRTANATSQEGPTAEAATSSVIAANTLPDAPEPVSPMAEPQDARDSSSQSSSSQLQQEPAQ